MTNVCKAQLAPAFKDEPILPANFLEKQDYESKEQTAEKIGGVSQQNQMIYLNK